MPRGNQGTENVTRNISPVERDGDKGYPSNTAKELVDNNIIGLDPCHESEDLETLSDPSGEPIPHKRANQNIEEIPIARDYPSICLGRVRW